MVSLYMSKRKREMDEMAQLDRELWEEMEDEDSEDDYIDVDKFEEEYLWKTLTTVYKADKLWFRAHSDWLREINRINEYLFSYKGKVYATKYFSE